MLAVTKQFAADHQAHADAIVAAVTQAGGTPAGDTAPPTDFTTLKSEPDILGALYGIERATAAAYLAALGELRNRDLARSTGAMLGVVTTHVALLGRGAPPRPTLPDEFRHRLKATGTRPPSLYRAMPTR